MYTHIHVNALYLGYIHFSKFIHMLQHFGESRYKFEKPQAFLYL